MGCQELREKGFIPDKVKCCTLCHEQPNQMQEVEVEGASQHRVCCGALAMLMMKAEVRLNITDLKPSSSRLRSS
jgi:hypothetical protein